jgi:dephospho-CoA kinase
MKKLQQIVWPCTRAEVLQLVDKIRSEWDPSVGKRPVVVVEAAVLLDAGWNDFLDGVWVITAVPNVARQRIMETRGLTEQEANQRMDAQLSYRSVGNLENEVAEKTVTRVINNSGSLPELTQALSQAINDSGAWY